ncbi:MAG: hypothetical protein JO166_15855 [Deltaproteobacteria bacterium]|nr:hypothetical protein [Deltaproteobacteria bacterium]
MAKARKPTFETLILRMFTEPDFLDEFAQGGTARAQALESIGLDSQDVQKIVRELDQIDYTHIKLAIQTMPHSNSLRDALKSRN